MAKTAILLAAGSSTRMGAEIPDKVLEAIAGKPLFLFAVEAFLRSGVVDDYILVYRDREQRAAMAEQLRQPRFERAKRMWVKGGVERRDSVLNALRATSVQAECIFIHDCARPLIRPETIRNLGEIAERDRAVCPAYRIADTIKTLRSGDDRAVMGSIVEEPGLLRHRGVHRGIVADLDRSHLWAVETPQVFERELILRAYEAVHREKLPITDDTAAVAHLGHPVTLLEIHYPNPKLTTMKDLPYIESLIEESRKSI